MENIAGASMRDDRSGRGFETHRPGWEGEIMIKAEAVQTLASFVSDHLQAGNFWDDPVYAHEVQALATLGFKSPRERLPCDDGRCPIYPSSQCKGPCDIYSKWLHERQQTLAGQTQEAE